MLRARLNLYVVNNTFVNDRKTGTFLNIAADADPAVVTNNVFFGGGTPSNQASAVLSHNYMDTAPCLLDTVAFDYQLAPGTPCVDGGTEPGDGDGFDLAPSAHYVHPAGSDGRVSVGSIDIGAFELGGDGAPAGGTNADGNPGSGGSQTSAAGRANGGNAAAGNGAGGQSSAGGQSNAGSSNGGSTTAGTSSAVDAPKEDAGCGCRLAGPTERARNLLALAGALALARARRKRR